MGWGGGCGRGGTVTRPCHTPPVQDGANATTPAATERPIKNVQKRVTPTFNPTMPCDSSRRPPGDGDRHYAESQPRNQAPSVSAAAAPADMAGLRRNLRGAFQEKLKHAADHWTTFGDPSRGGDLSRYGRKKHQNSCSVRRRD